MEAFLALMLAVSWWVGLVGFLMLDVCLVGMAWRSYQGRRMDGQPIVLLFLMSVPVFLVLWLFGVFNVWEFVQAQGWWTIAWVAGFFAVGIPYTLVRGLHRLWVEFHKIRVPVLREMKAAFFKVLGSAENVRRDGLLKAFIAADKLTSRLAEIRAEVYPDYHGEYYHGNYGSVVYADRNWRHVDMHGWFRERPSGVPYLIVLNILKGKGIPDTILKALPLYLEDNRQSELLSDHDIWVAFRRAAEVSERFEQKFGEALRKLGVSDDAELVPLDVAWKAYKMAIDFRRVDVGKSRFWIFWLAIFWLPDLIDQTVLRIFDRIASVIRVIVNFFSNIGQRVADVWARFTIDRV